jgi:hypothetical protein
LEEDYFLGPFLWRELQKRKGNSFEALEWGKIWWFFSWLLMMFRFDIEFFLCGRKMLEFLSFKIIFRDGFSTSLVFSSLFSFSGFFAQNFC